MNLKLKGDRVLVREANIDERMVGSIVAVQNRPQDDQIMRAEVIAVGDGAIRLPNATVDIIDPPCEVGDIVIVPRYQGWELDIFYTGETTKTKILPFAEVLAVEQSDTKGDPAT